MISNKKLFDLVLCLPLLLILIMPMLLVGFLVRVSSDGPALYWSPRVGHKGVIFLMPKYRSMYIYTPELATDKLENAENYVTTIGRFLRRTSLDELPQLLSIINGEMSLVGPRPALHNEVELISLRSHCGVDQLIPGLTGWAQVNGRDNITIQEKVALDKEYLSKNSIYFDIHILGLTFIKVLAGKDMSH
jgi:O-antigen biosynthesis protein WbqP